jgi:hypothetical protein
MARSRGRLARAAAALVCALALATATAVGPAGADSSGSGPTAGPSPGAQAETRSLQPPSSVDQPTDVVIAIDESGTLQGQMQLESQAAAAIVAAELNPDTRIAIVGFASQGNKDATDVCDLMAVGDPKARAELTGCLGDRIKPRSAADGNNTDYVAALKSAIGILTDPRVYTGKARRRIIYFLSDGWLDPGGQEGAATLAAGADANAVGKARYDLENTYLPLAKRNNIEIWPVAFGDGTHDTPLISGQDPRGRDLGFPLDQLADQALPQQAGCLATSALPSSVVWLQGPGDLTAKLLPMLALARCSYPGVSQAGTVGGDAVQVAIPAGVAAASITVLGAPPGARITVRPPRASAPPGAGKGPGGGEDQGGAVATVDDSDPVVSLALAQPAAGDWSVAAQAPPGSSGRGQPLTVVAVWSVNAWFSAIPAVVAPGTDIAVGVQLWANPDVLRDRKLMAGVKVQVKIEDLGLSSADASKAAAPVDLRDDGRGAGDPVTGGRAGDGLFQGFVHVPSGAKGTLVLVATVSGQSLGIPLCGDGRVACVEVHQPLTVGTAAAANAVQPQPSELTGTVPQGGETSGDIVVSGGNPTQRPGVAFGLANANPGVTIAGTQQISVGEAATTMRYSLGADRKARVGEHLRGQVVVYDMSGAPYVWTRIPFDLTVVHAADRPDMASWIGRRWWIIALVGLALVGLALAIYLIRRFRPRPEPVRGLIVRLYSGDGPEPVHHYSSPDPEATELAFRLFGEDGNRRLDQAEKNTADYRVRRKGRDVVLYWRKTYPHRRWQQVDWEVDGWPRLPVSGGITLELEDDIRRTGRGHTVVPEGGGN